MPKIITDSLGKPVLIRPPADADARALLPGVPDGRGREDRARPSARAHGPVPVRRACADACVRACARAREHVRVRVCVSSHHAYVDANERAYAGEHADGYVRVLLPYYAS